MKNILILCTGNSCRSQIAHGYFNNFSKNKTKSLAIKDTFSKNLLTSTRKRMENARKKYNK